MSFQQKYSKYQLKKYKGGAVHHNIGDRVRIHTEQGAYHVGVFQINNNVIEGNRGIGNAFPTIGYIISIKIDLLNNRSYDVLTVAERAEFPIKIYYNLPHQKMSYGGETDLLEAYPFVNNSERDAVLILNDPTNLPLLNNMIQNNIFTLNNAADQYFF
jgi:hypothetical protein